MRQRPEDVRRVLVRARIPVWARRPYSDEEERIDRDRARQPTVAAPDPAFREEQHEQRRRDEQQHPASLRQRHCVAGCRPLLEHAHEQRDRRQEARERKHWRQPVVGSAAPDEQGGEARRHRDQRRDHDHPAPELPVRVGGQHDIDDRSRKRRRRERNHDVSQPHW